MKNFAVVGVAGYVAPRHLKAIQQTGNRLVAALDPHDAVGILDRFSFDVRFFTGIERFDRELDKRRLGPESERVHYVSICSPNHVHDAHIRLALRSHAHAICEKPLVINPWNLDTLQALESEAGFRVYTVLQLRLHPQVVALRERLRSQSRDRKHDVCLSYVTTRGPWYDISWKGSPEHSGGIIVNIGIHFFDLLLWLFGPAQVNHVHLLEPHRASGFLELANARVRWFLSTNPQDLPFEAVAGGRTTFRSITVDGIEAEFSDGFGDLHTDVYRQVLAGHAPGIEDARPSIQLAHDIRHAPVKPATVDLHPMMTASR
jgi:UDP-N-acetyl-2-amino-2-deoxyglucuronate dehydrogenase